MAFHQLKAWLIGTPVLGYLDPNHYNTWTLTPAMNLCERRLHWVHVLRDQVGIAGSGNSGATFSRILVRQLIYSEDFK